MPEHQKHLIIHSTAFIHWLPYESIYKYSSFDNLYCSYLMLKVKCGIFAPLDRTNRFAKIMPLIHTCHWSARHSFSLLIPLIDFYFLFFYRVTVFTIYINVIIYWTGIGETISQTSKRLHTSPFISHVCLLICVLWFCETLLRDGNLVLSAAYFHLSYSLTLSMERVSFQ